MPFLSTYIDVRTLNFFPTAESWLVNSNFPHASRMQGSCRSPRPIVILPCPRKDEERPSANFMVSRTCSSLLGVDTGLRDMASHKWVWMMVMFAPVSTKNRTSVPFTIPLTYKPSLLASTVSVLTEGKMGLSVGGSVGLQPLNLTVSRFPDVP